MIQKMNLCIFGSNRLPKPVATYFQHFTMLCKESSILFVDLGGMLLVLQRPPGAWGSNGVLRPRDKMNKISTRVCFTLLTCGYTISSYRWVSARKINQSVRMLLRVLFICLTDTIKYSAINIILV